MAFDFDKVAARDAQFKRLGFVPVWPNAGKSAMGSLFVTLAETGKVGATPAEMAKALGSTDVKGEDGKMTKEPVLTEVEAADALAKMAKCGLVSVKDGRYFVKGNPTKTTWEAWKSMFGGGKPRSELKEKLLALGITAKKPTEVITALLAMIPEKKAAKTAEK